MLIYGFALETLVQTLLDLGADYVATHDSYGNMYISPNASDAWVNSHVQRALSNFIATQPIIGARRSVMAFSLSPLRVAMLIVSAVPGGYLVTVIGGLRGWLSGAIARKVADEIETWIGQRQTHWAPNRWSRF